MNKVTFLLALVLFAFSSCDDDHDHDGDTVFEYHINIISPAVNPDNVDGNAADMKVGQTLSLNVNFGSHTGEKVHNVSIKIYKVGDEETLAYDFHTHAHADGSYTHEDEVMLVADNNVEGHTDWILEAKVWGTEDGQEEVTETIGFHVHPE